MGVAAAGDFQESAELPKSSSNKSMCLLTVNSVNITLLTVIHKQCELFDLLLGN